MTALCMDNPKNKYSTGRADNESEEIDVDE